MSRSPATSIRSACAALLLTGLAGVAAAADFKSVGNDPAVLYDAPTLRGTKIFVAPRGMPVEVIVMQGDWVRVRDSSGGLSWVEKKALVDKRTLVVSAQSGTADVHAAADDASPVTFRVQAGVLVDQVAAPASGWVSLRTRDGQSGYAKVGDVWGD